MRCSDLRCAPYLALHDPRMLALHACRALLAKYRHEDNAALQAAALARRDPAVALNATLLMVQTYLQPLVDALWAGEATDAADVISVVSTCDQLLYSLDAAERTSTRWLVRFVAATSEVICVTGTPADGACGCHAGNVHQREADACQNNELAYNAPGSTIASRCHVSPYLH